MTALLFTAQVIHILLCQFFFISNPPLRSSSTSASAFFFPTVSSPLVSFTSTFAFLSPTPVLLFPPFPSLFSSDRLHLSSTFFSFAFLFYPIPFPCFHSPPLRSFPPFGFSFNTYLASPTSTLIFLFLLSCLPLPLLH